MQLTLGYPWGAILLCLALGFTYAALLYYRDRHYSEIASYWKFLMASLRAIFVASLAFFLLDPFLRFTEVEKEIPIILIGQDVSQSIAESDPDFDYSAYRRDLKAFTDELSKDYEVRVFSFGDRLEEGVNDSLKAPYTDYDALLNDWYDRFAHQNVGALVVATDGRYNRGSDPRYRSQQFDAPTYTVALGDTTQERDSRVTEVRHNELAFLGNRFPVQALVQADGYKGEEVTVSLRHRGSVIKEEKVKIEVDRFSKTIDFELEAIALGLQRYSVSISAPSEERNSANNERTFYVDIIDSRQKILLLTSAPHPDLAAIRASLKENERFEIEQKFIGRDVFALADYNLIVLYQPDFSQATTLWKNLNESEIPMWVFTGSTMQGKASAPWQPLVDIAQQELEVDEVGPTYVDGFSPFKLTRATLDWFKQVPPISVPFGTYTLNPGTDLLFQQKVGTVATDNPLVGYGDRSGRRWAFVAGEGIWRWRMADYQLNKSHDHFDEWVLRSAQYLASNSRKERFRVESARLFNENEHILMKAEVYNASFQAITDPEVRITVTNEAKEEFPFVFSRSSEGYRLNAGVLPIGSYIWEARTEQGGSSYVQRGAFTVRALEWELQNLRADHAMLQQWAENSGGQLVRPNGLMALATQIKQIDTVKPVLYEQSVLEELIEQRFIFFILLALISLEWFFRKRNGGY